VKSLNIAILRKKEKSHEYREREVFYKQQGIGQSTITISRDSRKFNHWLRRIAGARMVKAPVALPPPPRSRSQPLLIKIEGCTQA
jgi:hypothetical protein